MHLFIAAVLILGIVSPALAQEYRVQKPRPQFITISVDGMRNGVLDFARHPIEDLVGRQVRGTQSQEHDYESSDGKVLIDILEFRRRSWGLSAAIYPFGLSMGTTLGIRGSIETLPTIRMNFDGDEAPASYRLTGAKAYDVGVGLYVADRAPGFGLGAQAFIVGGVGRITADDSREGSRTFAEGGGGVMVGPFGVQIAAKFAWNRLDDPVEHRFLTVPVTVRATVSF